MGNAIAFKDPFSDNPCMLKDCDFPVPAPMGSPVCDEECGGYYRATALIKCPDMSVVDLGSKKCNDDMNDNMVIWYFNGIWDDGQNCLAGCISRMNQNNVSEACCEAMKVGNKYPSTQCKLSEVDVIEGDENSTDGKAVNCKVEPLTDTQASSDTSKTSTTTKLDSISTSTTNMSATKNQINPEDPDDGADSGSSTCKLNGKKKTFLMIHVTITQILLMLLVIIHKNV